MDDANGNNVEQPACRESAPITVKVQQQSTIYLSGVVLNIISC